MNPLAQIVADLKAAVPALRAKVESAAAERDRYRSLVEQYQGGVPQDVVSPTDVADLQSVLSDLQAIAAL